MSETKVKTACVLMVGPAEQMDHRGDQRKPANPLPVKCAHCTFPDIDFVANPYLLAKGAAAPTESAPAMYGNFLVRERLRRILEVVVPNACTFYPTAEYKSKKPLPWWLAVPNQKLATFFPKAVAPFCSKCGEPKVWDAHMGKVWEQMLQFDSQGVDVFKPIEWLAYGTFEDGFAETNRYRREECNPPLPPFTWSQTGLTAPEHPERWTRNPDRDLYFSIRLEQVIVRAKAKGRLVRVARKYEIETPPEDEAWIEAKLKLLAEHGLVDPPKTGGAKASASSEKWFKNFLKRNAQKGIKPVDFAALEKKHKLALPQTYKDFISTVGPKSFNDVNGTEEFMANVLAPAKLDFKDYRSGRVPNLDEEESKIDGVMFATTDHGDCFVFDVSAKGNDYPVYWYNHEENTLEPFAPNFAECIQRFVKKN